MTQLVCSMVCFYEECLDVYIRYLVGGKYYVGF